MIHMRVMKEIYNFYRKLYLAAITTISPNNIIVFI